MREEKNVTCQEVEKLTEVGNNEVTKLTSADDSRMIAAKPWPFSSYLLTQSGIVHNNLYLNRLEIATENVTVYRLVTSCRHHTRQICADLCSPV